MKEIVVVQGGVKCFFDECFIARIEVLLKKTECEVVFPIERRKPRQRSRPDGRMVHVLEGEVGKAKDFVVGMIEERKQGSRIGRKGGAPKDGQVAGKNFYILYSGKVRRGLLQVFRLAYLSPQMSGLGCKRFSAPCSSSLYSS